jgi:dUTP pyrophosphatase
MDNEGKFCSIKSVDEQNRAYSAAITNSALIIPSSTTMLIPTGLIAKIPSGYSLRIHMRSSVALKRGLIVPNGEGIIDADYFDELFMLIRNISNTSVVVKHGERICQGEIIKNVQFPIQQIYNRPEQTTNRTGGFGSTGE